MATAPRRIAAELRRLAGTAMDRRHLPRRPAPLGILGGIGSVAAVGIERVWAAVEARCEGGERPRARATSRAARARWAYRRAIPGGARHARSRRPPLENATDGDGHRLCRGSIDVPGCYGIRALGPGRRARAVPRRTAAVGGQGTT